MTSCKRLVTAVLVALFFGHSTTYSQNLHFDERNCGIRFLESAKEAKRIVGGRVSAPGAWPWQVALVLKGKQMCGGSLILPEWVVSASHCFKGPSLSKDPRDWTVTLGEHHLKTLDWFEQRRQVQAIYLHPKYKDAQSTVTENKVKTIAPDYDIAVLRLKDPAILDNFVSPICLLPSGFQFPPGKECYVTGWGHTSWRGAKPDILREAAVKLVNQEKCNHEKSYGGAVHNRSLCAGFDEGGVDACQYDSGGPLACELAGKWYLTGVVSWGHNCGYPHKYGVYADMQIMQGWVKKVTGQDETKKS
ncbi:transmembrane protease serine 2-like isoform X2 [Acropora muricata]|uniref:transmembrane protease serine 2-like isoform X2 n=1 Tax=Acropora muricata TaxID=159855 RepID=UPI0034E38421